MTTAKMYCYVVIAEPREPEYDSCVHCVCLSEEMAEQVCEKMNATDQFNTYDHYRTELQK